MPLHLLPIMVAVLGFMLWIAFQDADEAELFEAGDGDEASPTAALAKPAI